MSTDGKPYPPFLILGTHGSGLTTALDIYADHGFMALANVPPGQVAQTVLPLSQQQAPVAFTIRLAPDTDAVALIAELQALKAQWPALKVLALDSPEEVLVQRYLQSEKRHAFESPELAGLQAAIAAEKKLFAPVKELKDYSIDTSTTTAEELRHKIARILGLPIENEAFTVYINTFGFKYGAPQDAELVFDMRFMTNPFYDERLRPMTGQDQPVRDFIFNLAHARTFFDKWADLVADMLPLYQAQGKTRLTIGVGCTGGKHRSVCMGEALATYLKERYPTFHIIINHREMLKWGKPALVESQGAGLKPAQASACSIGEVAGA
ncbi:RNase adapter RapZ [Vampirovibrio chlorellavorus]|uniref:RNase adapter RapZ n=1 Tax=Vampirovibrio chlorellavorus TaxID=758823 RepID=UPI0026EDA789|nr:RNase adapter RapZ [Vampirovibrio chlorellavorus]